MRGLLCLASFTSHNVPKGHPYCSMYQYSLLFVANIPLYSYTTFYLSILQWMDFELFAFFSYSK